MKTPRLPFATLREGSPPTISLSSKTEGRQFEVPLLRPGLVIWSWFSVAGMRQSCTMNTRMSFLMIGKKRVSHCAITAIVVVLMVSSRRRYADDREVCHVAGTDSCPCRLGSFPPPYCVVAQDTVYATDTGRRACFS